MCSRLANRALNTNFHSVLQPAKRHDEVPMRRPIIRKPSRAGFASVLAMLYLVLFSTLAVGFYVASSLSTQVSRNERSSTIAQQGAESGMEYMRYQLGAMTVPPGTTNDTLLATVYGL